MSFTLHFASQKIPLVRPLIMGILNITPDSFSDGGCYATPASAIAQGMALIEQGADILDIGGESSRPYAQPITADEELKRVLPVLRALRKALDIPLSVDTYKPAVMHAVIQEGADMINDIRALQETGALEVVARSSVAICLMHMRGVPATMQQQPSYENVLDEVRCFLLERKQAALNQGIEAQRIVLDPGFGFGKRLQDNLSLFQQLNILAKLGSPLLIGVSRKSMLSTLLNLTQPAPLSASISASILAVQAGAHIVRVHDVAETVSALRILHALQPSTANTHDAD